MSDTRLTDHEAPKEKFGRAAIEGGKFWRDGDDDPASGTRKPFDINLPSSNWGINLNLSLGEGQPQQEREKREERDPGKPLDIKFPELKMPELNMNIPGVKLPDFDLGIKLPDMPEMTLPNFGVNLNFGDPLSMIGEIANMNGAFDDIDLGVDMEPIREAAEATYEATKEVVDPVLEAVGNAAKPVADFIAEQTDEISKKVNEAMQPVIETTKAIVGDVAETLGESAQYLSEHTKIKQGDGSQFGEIKVGDGVVLDVNEVMQNSYDLVTKDTVLEGYAVKDIAEIATNPTKFIETHATDKAVDFMSDAFNLDKDFSGELVQAIANPQQFINNKGQDVVTDFVSSATGLDKGVVGVVGQLAQAKDVGQAAETLVKEAVKQTVMQTVQSVATAINPVLGAVVAVVSWLCKCNLATASYEAGLLTKKQYLMFPKYRARIQKFEPMSDIFYIGYLGYSRIFAFFMRRSPLFLNFIHKLMVMPWLGYCNAKLSGQSPSVSEWLVVNVLMRTLSIVGFFALLPISLIGLAQHKTVGVTSLYRGIIRKVEGARA